MEVQKLYQEAIKFATAKHLEKEQKVPGTDLPYVVHLSNVAMEIIIAAFNSDKFNLGFAFPIPLSALNGATRIRIQMQAGAQETNPCATYTYGEVEDYSVVITSTIAGSVGTSPDFKNITKENNTDFMFYPVSAKGNLTVEFTSISDDNVKLNVYNLSGQKLMTIESPSIRGLNTFKLNTNRLIPGFYFLEVYNNGQRQHQKFLIAR